MTGYRKMLVTGLAAAVLVGADALGVSLDTETVTAVVSLAVAYVVGNAAEHHAVARRYARTVDMLEQSLPGSR